MQLRNRANGEHKLTSYPALFVDAAT